jgi:hypothetical protein
MFNFAPINWRNTIVFCVLGLLFGLCAGRISVQEWRIHHATNQAQAYMESRVVQAGYDFTVNVDHCTELPTKRDGLKHDWVCRVTISRGQEEEAVLLQFTPNNLAGKLDPVEKQEIEFDHSKDTNI